MYDRGMATGTLERLEDRLADLCGHRNTLDALLVQLVARGARKRARGRWTASRRRRIGWRGKPGCPRRTRNQLVTVAKRRGELPVTFAAFDAGELSLDQVVPIATRAPRWADGGVV